MVEVRGLYKAICEAGIVELRAVPEESARGGALEAPDLDIATRLVATVIASATDWAGKGSHDDSP